MTGSGGVAEAFPPLIFVHGNGDSSALWLTTAWRFASHGWPSERLIALDFPFPSARDDDAIPQNGRSGSADQRECLLAQIADTLARSGAQQVVLIGNSRGGNAVRSVLKDGDAAPRVSHAILCGTPSHGVVNVPGNNSEFNGAGAFLRRMNAGGETVAGVRFLTIRSARDDKYAQPELATGRPSGVDYDSPALRGATNIALPGIDHRETAYSPQAFAAMHHFITGRESADPDIVPAAPVVLDGRVTGHAHGVPTNLGVGGVTVAIYALDPASGARRGAARHERMTGVDGRWGPFEARGDTPYEFVVAAPGEPVRHIFRSPFPRSSPYVGLRLTPETSSLVGGLVIFSRPCGYIATGRDTHLLDGQPVPGVAGGVPTESIFRVPLPGPERPVLVALNGESFVVRNIPGAITYAEFHY